MSVRYRFTPELQNRLARRIAKGPVPEGAEIAVVVRDTKVEWTSTGWAIVVTVDVPSGHERER
jgi:hypothetical protein